MAEERETPRRDTEEERAHEAYQELGHKGGEATAEKHGREFYEDIGKKGGEARKEQMAEGEVTEEEEK